MKLKSSPLIVIFLIVFIDLVGFGIIIPLSPYFAQKLGATPTEVGLLMTIFSLMQFLFSPFWGKLSDKYGRRPILLISLLGSSLSYFMMAYATEFNILLFSRAFAGFFGANISTAMAYIADVTSEKERSKGMGLIGAAFGLGFIMGPAIGGGLTHLGFKLGEAPPFGMGFAALGAGVICFLNFLLAIKVLKESLPIEKRQNLPKRESRFKLVGRYLFRPALGTTIVAVFLSTFAMANMESTLALFVEDKYKWNVTQASFAFAYVGLISVFTQGFLIRKLMPKFGEPILIFVGFIMAGLGLSLIGFSKDIPLLVAAVTIMGLGVGCLNPSLLGSVSLKASANEQGSAMGVSQSFSSLGRILGPICGGMLFQYYGKEFPFYFAGIVMLFGFVLMFTIRKQLPNSSLSKNNLDSTSEKNSYMKIGEYQFTNLLAGPVRFTMFDLRKENKRPKLRRALRVNESNIISTVEQTVESLESPVLIICEDGSASMKVADALANKGYKNIVILDKGVNSLSEEFHRNTHLLMYK